MVNQYFKIDTREFEPQIRSSYTGNVLATFSSNVGTLEQAMITADHYAAFSDELARAVRCAHVKRSTPDRETLAFAAYHESLAAFWRAASRSFFRTRAVRIWIADAAGFEEGLA